jgi:hypothetical protein
LTSALKPLLPAASGDGDRVDVRENPATENWQKTLGMHFMWVTADVKVDGNRLTATATVNVRDWYNFNPGGKDIATEVPDDSNGRFSTIGWAKGSRLTDRCGA